MTIWTRKGKPIQMEKVRGLAFHIIPFSKAEVYQHWLLSMSEKDVSRFNVIMNNSMSMKMSNAIEQRLKPNSSFGFMCFNRDKMGKEIPTQDHINLS